MSKIDGFKDKSTCILLRNTEVFNSRNKNNHPKIPEEVLERTMRMGDRA